MSPIPDAYISHWNDNRYLQHPQHEGLQGQDRRSDNIPLQKDRAPLTRFHEIHSERNVLHPVAKISSLNGIDHFFFASSSSRSFALCVLNSIISLRFCMVRMHRDILQKWATIRHWRGLPFSILQEDFLQGLSFRRLLLRWHRDRQRAPPSDDNHRSHSDPYTPRESAFSRAAMEFCAEPSVFQ